LVFGGLNTTCFDPNTGSSSGEGEEWDPVRHAYILRTTTCLISRSRAVYGRLPTAIVGSNPKRGMDFFCCVCCVWSGRGLCDELITRPGESYRSWRVVVCDHETSCYEEAIARAGLQCQRNNKQRA
jgi:hypothetical protein